jgi:ammonia channel protein AmtB
MDQGNTAFLLICSALVLLMTPGLAFFYGGLVKAKSVISMMMMSFGAMGLIGVLWVLYGYAITFSNGGTGGFYGIDGVFGIDTANLGLDGLLAVPEGAAYPPIAFAAFQATFAIITVALISGAIADRAKFGAWMIFAGVWVTVVYFPVASWVFNFTLDPETLAFTDGGWITYGMQQFFGVGAIDFAGGTAVHINAGAAALALALVLGKRVGFAKGAHVPHTHHSSFSVPVSSGSAGSASTRVPSSPLTEPQPSRSSTPSPLLRQRFSPGSSLRRSRTASRPPSVQHPVPSLVWLPSPRPAHRSTPSGRSSSASSPVLFVPLPST